MIDTKKLYEDFCDKASLINIDKLFGDNVIIKPIEEEKISKGGIIIPDSVDNIKNVSRGIVIRAGEGAYDQQTGKFKPISVKVGDTVLYDSNCLIMKDPEWDNLYLISEKDIITVIK
ncbi:MAG: co-chaperone GroES [Ferruginibacter sp.]